MEANMTVLIYDSEDCKIALSFAHAFSLPFSLQLAIFHSYPSYYNIHPLVDTFV